MSSDTKIIGGIFGPTLLVLIGIVMIGSSDKPGLASPITATAPDEPALVRDHSHRVGPTDAPVEIVEFADFQCPACARTDPFLEELLSEYGEQISFVHRHFPLPNHTNAIPAARAAEAAGFQGKFFEMGHLLYQEQTSWATAVDPLPQFQEFARQLELDGEAFTDDLVRDDSTSWIAADLGDGDALSVNSTPTIFVNGQIIGAPGTYADLKAAVDAALGVAE